MKVGSPLTCKGWSHPAKSCLEPSQPAKAGVVGASFAGWDGGRETSGTLKDGHISL